MANEDALLLERAVAGDTPSLRSLLERVGPQIWNDIRGQIGPHYQAMIDADDVMQVTYLEAFLQAEQLAARDVATFVAWLRRVAENNLRDAIRELERKKRPSPAKRLQDPGGEESYVALIERLGNSSSTPSRHAARGEASRIVTAALERLPTDYATALRMYDIEGKAISDVASAMGRSPGAVHMLRARALDRLRSLLGAPGDYFTDAV